MRIQRLALAVLILTFTLTSTLYARHRSAPAGPQHEIEGVVKSVSDTQLVVTDNHNNDVTLTITPNTIFRAEDVAIAPSDLKEGDRVHVKATQNGSELDALMVELQNDQQPGPLLLELNGTIKSVSSTEIVVTDARGNDTTVEITPTTIIRKGDQIVTTADLAVGDRVQVKAMKTATATNALLINDQTEPEQQDQEVEISGTVKSTAASSITVTTRHGDVVVNTDANTRIRKNGRTVAIGDINTGDAVSAEGTRVDATTILAREIDVHSTGGHH